MLVDTTSVKVDRKEEKLVDFIRFGEWRTGAKIELEISEAYI